MSKIGARRAFWATTVVAFLQLGSMAACAPPASDRMESQYELEVQASPASNPTMPQSGTRVVLLGSGTPNAEPDRSGPAVAILVDNTAYLVDAGPGVVRRAALAQRELGIEALEASRLEHVFLTHLHSDHTVGLPDLLLTPWVLGRSAPLTIIGPVGTQAMADHLGAAYEQDIAIRLEGLEPANTGGFAARVTEITAEEAMVFEDERIRVTAYRVPHGDWPNAYGYRFETADRTIVVSGDAGPEPELIARMCTRCDVLVHEVYARAGWEKRAPEWRRYHASFHTSAPELGKIAAGARPGHLVLYHQLLWSATEEQVIREVQENWNGQLTYGNDLDVF